MEAILRIENLDKSFGKKQVLNDFSMAFEPGKVYGLLGRNGEGKTTLCRLLMGVIPPDRGSMTFREKAFGYGDHLYKRNFGFIPEDSIFFGWMTIGRMLEFNAAFYPSWKASKAEHYLKRFGLEKGTRIKHLSRGMKLKLGLLLALAAEPEILILDDPTSGLDVPTRRDFLKDIIDEILEGGSTILFFSHLVHELEGLVDHLGILHQGRMILDEEMETIKSRICKVSVVFEDAAPEEFRIEGILSEKTNGRRRELVIYPWKEELRKEILSAVPCRVETEPLSLEDIFVQFTAQG